MMVAAVTPAATPISVSITRSVRSVNGSAGAARFVISMISAVKTPAPASP